jgi:thioredoxin-related protein
MMMDGEQGQMGGGAPAQEHDPMYPNGFDAEGVRAPLPSVRDRLIGGGMGSLDSYSGYEVEREENIDWVFPPPEGLSVPVSFDDTRQLCKDQERWLLVNLQDNEIFTSHKLNRDIWSDDTVRTIIQTSFLFWQRNRTSRQGQTFLDRYRVPVDKLPLISIIDPRTGLMLLKIEGYVEKEDLCAMLVDFLDANHITQVSRVRPDLLRSAVATRCVCVC